MGGLPAHERVLNLLGIDRLKAELQAEFVVPPLGGSVVLNPLQRTSERKGILVRAWHSKGFLL
jgi:hypothetical protein